MPVAEHEQLLHEALSAALSLDEEEWVADEFEELIALSNPPFSIIPLILEGAFDFSEDESSGPGVMRALAAKSEQLDETDLPAFWDVLIQVLSEHPRGDLLQVHETLSTVLLRLDGKKDIAEFAHAVVDVSRWWP